MIPKKSVFFGSVQGLSRGDVRTISGWGKINFCFLVGFTRVKTGVIDSSWIGASFVQKLWDFSRLVFLLLSAENMFLWIIVGEVIGVEDKLSRGEFLGQSGDSGWFRFTMGLSEGFKRF